MLLAAVLAAACASTERTAPLAAAGDPVRGREVFVSRDAGHCVLCHRAPGVTPAGNVGPPLGGIGSRLDAAELRLRIADITKVYPDSVMPTFHRTEGMVRVAPQYAGKALPLQAGIVTLAAFGGLTAAVFISGKDFSFMGPVLWVLSFLALGLIIAAVIGGFSLGLGFAVAMVALACGFIIYDTSNVIHHYNTNQHVAASLELFAAVALLFWYVLRIFMFTSQDD